jgi:hypothetical protein
MTATKSGPRLKEPNVLMKLSKYIATDPRTNSSSSAPNGIRKEQYYLINRGMTPIMITYKYIPHTSNSG